MKLICGKVKCYTCQHQLAHGVMISSTIIHTGVVQINWMPERNEQEENQNEQESIEFPSSKEP